MFGKLITTLAIATFCLGTTAGLAGLAFADDESPNLARGEQLFQLCTQCHGTNGGGNVEALAPAIAGMPDWYVLMQLQNFKNGIRGLHAKDTGGLRMYPMSIWLRDEADQAAVSAYVASLPKTDPPRELENPGEAEKGAAYFAVCSACHGADAGGNPLMKAPPLAGLSDWYLYSSIQKYKSGIRGSNPKDIYGAAMIGMVATLPNDQAVRDVIAYIQSLEKK